MEKKWKIIIGVVAALVIVGCVALPIVGAMFFRGRLHGTGWAPGPLHRWESMKTQHHELEVELVDDDGDGVPDRGVIEFPEEMSFGRGCPVGGRFDRFGPRHGMPFGGHSSGPFFVVGGLVRLAFLAAVVVLGIAFYRQWRKAHPVTPPASE